MNYSIEYPLVSICCVTYNHENYLSQCLDGFLSQKSTFTFEILVNEDASSDKTPNILKAYETSFSSLFHCVYQKRNQFNEQNTLTNELFPIARGKYIALCEGDDYWSDPNKLQKQIDFLENNPEYVMCHHWQKIAKKNKDLLWEEKPWDRSSENGYPLKFDFDISEVFKFSVRPQTRTMVFRNVFKENPLPDWFHNIKYGDVALSFLLGKHGKFKFIDEDMAVYRISGEGLSSIFNSKSGYITGNYEWMKLYAYAIKHYNYLYQNEALIGFDKFIKRIVDASSKKAVAKIKLLLFVFSLNLKFGFKLKLYNNIINNKYV